MQPGNSPGDAAARPQRRRSDVRHWTIGRSPIVETIAAMTVTTMLAWLSTFANVRESFILAPPVIDPPWALVLSVYAHAGPAHLLSNAVVVAVASVPLVRATTRLRFHAFVIGTGALAGIAQVWAGGLTGASTAVLGASGAAFALVGYVLVANSASTALLDRLSLSGRAGVALLIAVGAALALLFSAPGSALVAHLVGTVLGLVAGRYRLLRS